MAKKSEENDQIFADPTYDATFKMLFGNEKNKDILISILNNFLDFTGEKEIKEVQINSSDLISEGLADIKGSVDVLCTTKNNQKIAVEMQRKYKDYFLPRSQEYMSKIIMGQVKDGQGDKYDQALMDTYILSIGKQNIFRGKYELNDKNIFEETVVPWVKETNQEVPGNKMHWKFFELSKFIKAYKNTNIDQDSPLKEQWLDFLVKCGEQKNIPNNINNIIKKGYEIMKIANWSEDERTLYWKQKANEFDEIQEQERLNNELKEQAFDQGKWKGEVKGEIKQEKDYLTQKRKFEELYKSQENKKFLDDAVDLIKPKKFVYINVEKLDEYFSNNDNALTQADNESMIMGELNLEYQQ